MFLDTTLLFNSYATPVAVTVTGDSSIIDLTGAGVGVAPAMIGGTPGTIGIDVGAGDGVAIPSVNVTVGTTFVGTGNTTMSVAIKAAPQVSATNNAEGTYTTLLTSAPIAVANLIAGASFNLPIPPITLSTGELPPRFYKLAYTVANGPFTGGKLSAGIVVNQPNITEGSQFPNNFVALP